MFLRAANHRIAFKLRRFTKDLPLAAGTFFWVSPVDDMVVILFTQLLPSSAIPVRKELRALVHGALTGA